MMKKAICFDMDGTISDLYAVDNWLEMLRAEDPKPYLEASPMWDMEKLHSILIQLQKAGWEIQIITWLSKNSSEEYKEAVRLAKLVWLKKYGFIYDHFHGVQYGATKADSVRKSVDYAILIDDNKKVRDGWHLGETIDPTSCDLLEVLSSLI
jgi:hydroxymethylpyrimidine pyrophosphatase-like HAD family hydrolase